MTNSPTPTTHATTHEPLPVLTPAAMAAMMAIDWVQRAPIMLAEAITTEGPEGDAQVRAIIAACPNLLANGKLGRNEHLPLFYAVEAKAWDKAALLIQLGASTTGLFQYLLRYSTTLKIPELEAVLEALFTAWLEGEPTPHDALRKLLERGRPDWAWRYCMFRLRQDQRLFGDYEVRNFMITQTDKLPELLALPDVAWPCLINQRMPFASWQLIAQQRPDLLETSDYSGENLLHGQDAAWVREVAVLLPDAQLVRMLEQKDTGRRVACTPWQEALLEKVNARARAIWELVQAKQLPINLALQQTEGGMTPLHLALANMERVDVDFIRWVSEVTGLAYTVEGGGYQACEMTGNRHLLK